MANTVKINVTVSRNRSTQTVRWTCNGKSGTLNVAQETGLLYNQPLASQTTPKAYVTDVLNQVIAGLT